MWARHVNRRLGFHNKQMLRGTDLIPTNCDGDSSLSKKKNIITTGNIKVHSISQDRGASEIKAAASED